MKSIINHVKGKQLSYMKYKPVSSESWFISDLGYCLDSQLSVEIMGLKKHCGLPDEDHRLTIFKL